MIKGVDRERQGDSKMESPEATCSMSVLEICTRDRGRDRIGLARVLGASRFGGKSFYDILRMIFIYNTHSYDLE